MESWKIGIAILLMVCFLWMDFCLYFQIQFMGDYDVTSNISAPSNKTMKLNDAPINPETASKLAFAHPSLFNKTLVPPIELINKFSFAFRGMSIKLMMTDPVDNYILAPISEALVDLVNFKENLLFITPNIVSYLGVLSALIAAKLVSYDSSNLHKLSYLFFQLRTWLDDLDGAVARSRMGIRKHQSMQRTSGYVVDGVCDAIGFVAYIIGCYIYMRKSIRRICSSRPGNRYNLRSITEVKSDHSDDHSTYVPLQQDCDEIRPRSQDKYRHDSDDVDDLDYHDTEIICRGSKLRDVEAESRTDILKAAKRKDLSRSRIYLERIEHGKQSSVIFYRFIKEKIKSNINKRHLLLLFLCFLLQLALAALFWNKYILIYRELLESPSTDMVQGRNKSKLLKSNILYAIIWFWRLTNGHSLMQMLIAAVFFGRLWQFLDFIKFVGFAEILLLVSITELHVVDVRNFLAN